MYGLKPVPFELHHYQNYDSSLQLCAFPGLRIETGGTLSSCKIK